MEYSQRVLFSQFMEASRGASIMSPERTVLQARCASLHRYSLPPGATSVGDGFKPDRY